MVHTLYTFKRVYDLRLWVKFLTWLALFASVLLLVRIEGGLPPPAWSVLAQSAPQLSQLLATRGATALLPFTGLLVLSATWVVLWLLLVGTALFLLWHAWFPPRRARRQARNWRRTSLDNLLVSGYDEPQASMVYASAQASFEQLTSPTTPYPELPTRPKPKSHPPTRPLPNLNPVGARAEQARVEGLYGRPPAPKSAGASPHSRPPAQERRSTRPLSRTLNPVVARAERIDMESLYGRSRAQARPGSRPPRAEQPATTTTRDIAYGYRKAPPTVDLAKFIEEESTASSPSRAGGRNAQHHMPTAAGADQRVPDHEHSVGVGWDAGITRRNKPNEDSVLALHGTCIFAGKLMPVSLFAVADGMGGHASGQVASHLATHSLMQTVLPAIQHGEDLTEDFLVETMVECAHQANQAVHQYREEHGVDLGTTLTAALVVESTTCIVNVGDSRTYLYRSGKGLRQVTLDHSLVARLVIAGMISPDEVYTHPDRNKVYRCLGEKAGMQVDWFIEPVQPGDSLLLCSDGLWELVRDHEIEKILHRCIPNAAEAADALVKAALHRGGNDNISAIVAIV